MYIGGDGIIKGNGGIHGYGGIGPCGGNIRCRGIRGLSIMGRHICGCRCMS